MKKVFLTICLASFLTTDCRADNVVNNQNVIYVNMVHQKSGEKIEHNYNDVNDLRWCQTIYELGEWSKSKVFYDVWERSMASIDNGIVYEGELYLDSKNKLNSVKLINNKKFHIAYIGPWQPTTLTHTEGSFFNKKKITEEKQIRFVAYQSIDYKNSPALNYHGDIRYFFESMNDQNKNIPAKPLSLLPDAVPNEVDLCVIKWNANFGYNAVAEVKSKNPFSKNYLVPTGKVIDAKE